MELRAMIGIKTGARYTLFPIIRIAGLNDGNTSHNRENNGPEPRIPPYRLKNEKKDGLYAKYGVRLKSL